MARELPTGTVTFFFTDVEGSTNLLERLGAGYQDVLVEHHQLLRSVFAEHGGVEVDTQGDAFFVAFTSANAAALAAAEAQRRLRAADLAVRIGLHSGEATVAETGYIGTDVHRAARICAAAHGRQIVLSQATRELVEDELPDELALRDLGEHRLKDLTRPQRLHQLLIAGLPSEFPPLRTLEQRPTNLPIQQAPLIGRERELRETRELLAQTQLLTLTGPGGTGKTRLAIQLAAEVLEEYDDGAFFVDLANVGNPDLVVPTVAEALGIKERGGVMLREAVAEHIGGKQLLLVLDNVEQVVEAAPDIGSWLAVASDSKVLATGRTPLRLAREQEYPVSPLGDDAAVELFAERAQAVRPSFALNGDRAVVAEICARLDALPLAIELAAARVKLLPPSKLLERLEQRLPLLTGGARDAPERHQTLRATIDWSFRLLDEEEQELLAQLSVFTGGFTLEAAEAVCEATIDALASLVDKSLIAEREGVDGDPRFAMLETVREYARERLGEWGEANVLAKRHAEYFLSLAEEAAQGAPDEDSEKAAGVYLELDNLRRALAWFVASGDVERELRFATASFWSLWSRAKLRELQGWLISALDRAPGADAELRGRALGAAALAAANLGEVEVAREYARQSLALARERNDKRQIEWALRVLTFDEPDLEERRRLLDECEHLLREVGSDAGLAWVTWLRGIAFLDEGAYEEARGRFEEAAAIFGGLGRRWEMTNAAVATAYALIGERQHTAARTILERSLATGVELESSSIMMESLHGLAATRLEADPVGATRLLAASSSLADEAGLPLDPHYEVILRDATEEAARERLGDRFEREWEAGRALSRDEAVALALGDER